VTGQWLTTLAMAWHDTSFEEIRHVLQTPRGNCVILFQCTSRKERFLQTDIFECQLIWILMLTELEQYATRNAKCEETTWTPFRKKCVGWMGEFGWAETVLSLLDCGSSGYTEQSKPATCKAVTFMNYKP